MYAHQVIEDLKKLKWYATKTDPEKIDFVIQNIRDAQHFHFGKDVDIVNKLGTSAWSPLFRGEAGIFVDPPYNKCWFDLDATYNVDSSKYGFLLSKHSKSFVSFMCFEKSKKHDIWFPHGLSYLIWIHGDTDPDYDELEGFDPKVTKHLVLPDGTVTSSSYFSIFTEIDGPIDFDVDSMIEEGVNRMFIPNMCLMLLNCKNISTEDQPAPARLNKKRAKTGKQPLFSYKILNISLPSKKRGASGSTVGMSDPKRLHLCRGHFKTYTEENPLFGQHVGRYFWQPTIRGDKKAGLVMKDYNIRASK